jgi:hypothetical protein
MSLCFAGCLSPGPRKNNLTIYWALGPFVRSFTLLVDPRDIYPPHLALRIFFYRRLDLVWLDRIALSGLGFLIYISHAYNTGTREFEV